MKLLIHFLILTCCLLLPITVLCQPTTQVANRLVDQSQLSNGVMASTYPTVGMLFPLSTLLNIKPTGQVGIGILNPASTLHVKGSFALMGNDQDTSNGRLLDFYEIPSAAPATGAGGFRMTAAYTHAGGINGAPRAVIMQWNGALAMGLDEFGNSLGNIRIGTPNGIPGQDPKLLLKGDFGVMGNDPNGSGGVIFHLKEVPSYAPVTGAVGFTINAAYPHGSGWNSGPRARVIYYNGDTLLATDEYGEPLGKVGIGIDHPEDTLDVAGSIRGHVLKIKGADLAEMYEVSDKEARPGMVVSIDPNNPGKLSVAKTAYDHMVAGIISGAGDLFPGTILSNSTVGDAAHPVALAGRVYCLAEAIDHAIEPGDLLTTSEWPGYAMKATDAGRRAGAVIGKAMSRLDSGHGLVLVLVSLG